MKIKWNSFATFSLRLLATCWIDFCVEYFWTICNEVTHPSLTFLPEHHLLVVLTASQFVDWKYVVSMISSSCHRSENPQKERRFVFSTGKKRKKVTVDDPQPHRARTQWKSFRINVLWLFSSIQRDMFVSTLNGVIGNVYSNCGSVVNKKSAGDILRTGLNKKKKEATKTNDHKRMKNNIHCITLTQFNACFYSTRINTEIVHIAFNDSFASTLSSLKLECLWIFTFPMK